MSSCDYNALRDVAQRLIRLGLRLQTVIPIALSADDYPVTKRNGVTGEWEVQRGKDGKPRPAFVGKNPSYWLATGEPRLVSHRQALAWGELSERIEVAERLGKPIGLAVIPSTDVVVVDFDRKNYASQEEFDREWLGLLDRYPELARTRMERTPGGGVHIYVKPTDGMQSWSTAAGKLHCNFTTHPGGEHRGEVLAGTRVCVCAPTANGSGRYELVNPDFAYSLLEVPSLGAIGIHPVAQGSGSSSGKRSSAGPRATEQHGAHTGLPVALEELIGGKAREVLAGGSPYRGGEGAEVDRSAQLTGFVREVHSWVNFLLEQGLAFSGRPEVLIEKAVRVLAIEDKADRVLATIDPLSCRHRDPDAALRRYRRLSSGSGGGSGFSGSQGASPSAASPGRPTLQQALEQLADAAINGSALSFRLERIAADHDRSLRDVQGLYQELVQEQEAALDADDSLDQLEQLGATVDLDVSTLMPPALLESLQAIRRTAEFQHSTLLAVLLAGLSAALPLRSSIELDPAEDFSQPLTLWVLLLMPSGELKTPLLNRLLVKPWYQTVDAVVAQAHRQQVQEWEIKKLDAESGAGPSPGPAPRLPQTLVTEDLTVQGVEVHLELHDKWANRSVCIWLDEAAATLRQMADPSRAGKDATLGGWLLSRYDGTGARGAKVDQSRERHYKSCRLAMVAGCQPDVYREITGDADQSGLSARFIVIEQLSVQQHFPTSCSEDDIQRAEALEQMLVRCFEALARIEQLQLRLSPEAFELFQTERAAMYQRKRASISAAERSLANKAAGRIGRLAALFHLLWCVAERAEGPISLGNGTVGVEAMQRAVRFNRLLLDQTVGVRLTSAGNSELGALMLKLQRVAWEKQKPLSLSTLRRALSGKQRPESAEVLHALQVLQERGYGVLEQMEYKGQQGWKYEATKPLLAAS
jgi:hypothetical protein